MIVPTNETGAVINLAQGIESRDRTFPIRLRQLVGVLQDASALSISETVMKVLG